MSKASLSEMVDEIELSVQGRESRIEICTELASKRRFSQDQVDRMEERLPVLMQVLSLLKILKRNEAAFRPWLEETIAKERAAS